MSMPLGGAKQSKLIAISTVPSFNYTTHKKDAVAAYTLTRVLDNAVDTVACTTFNGKPAYVLTQTTQLDCQGDEAGVGGGVKSGTVGGEVKPTSGSSTIFIEGKALVRESDTCTMNNENTVGVYISFENMTDGQRKALADNSDEPPEYGEDGFPVLGSDNGHVNRTKTNADHAEETARMNERIWEAKTGQGAEIIYTKEAAKNNPEIYTILTKPEEFIGQHQAMKYLLKNGDDANAAWGDARKHRLTYAGLDEKDRNAEHYLYALDQVRSDPTKYALYSAGVAVYGGGKSIVNGLGRTQQVFFGNNSSPTRGSPVTKDQIDAGLAGARHGKYGIK